MRISASLSFVLFVFCVLAISSSAQTGSTDNSQRVRGVELYRQQKYREAADLLKQADKKDKSDADAWYYLGLTLLQDPKALKGSSQAFETATKLRPNFAGAHAAYSYSLLIRNKNDAAAREARAALVLDPAIAEAYYVLGVTQLRAGAKKEALQNADTAIRLHPQIAPAYLLKSQALVTFFAEDVLSAVDVSTENKKDRFREAAEALEKYLQLSPNGPDRETWVQQLESLRYFANSPKPGENKLVFSGKEVTTKARVLSKPEPMYTETARVNGVTGRVVLRCVFAADGTTKHFLILSGLPLGLTEQAIKAARKIKFIPAMVDGRPVNMYIQLEYNFNLY